MKNKEFTDIAREPKINRETPGHFRFHRRNIPNNINDTRGRIDENGVKKIIEIEESVFFGRKYKWAGLVNPLWFFAV